MNLLQGPAHLCWLQDTCLLNEYTRRGCEIFEIHTQLKHSLILCLLSARHEALLITIFNHINSYSRLTFKVRQAL